MIDLTFLDFARLWLSMSFITLAMLCYTDLRSREVDTRRNSVMIGAGLMATIPTGLGFIYIIHVFVVILFNKVFSKLNKRIDKRYIASGDQKALFWIIPGFVLLGSIAPAVFMVVLVGVLSAVALIQAKFNKPFGKKMPGIIILSAAFIITVGLFL